MEHLVIRKNNETNLINLSEEIFDIKYNEMLLHQLVTTYINNSHIGTKKQKSRGLVSGGGKKPWKQKGTGRARSGSIRSPLWKGGGKIFAAKETDIKKKKMNKKVYKLGMKIIFSELFRTNKINIIEELNITKIKTKNFLEEISYLKFRHLTLFIFKNINSFIYLSTRNLKSIIITSCYKLNPITLIKSKNIFISIEAIKYIEENLK